MVIIRGYMIIHVFLIVLLLITPSNGIRIYPFLENEIFDREMFAKEMPLWRKNGHSEIKRSRGLEELPRNDDIQSVPGAKCLSIPMNKLDYYMATLWLFWIGNSYPGDHVFFLPDEMKFVKNPDYNPYMVQQLEKFKSGESNWHKILNIHNLFNHQQPRSQKDRIRRSLRSPSLDPSEQNLMETVYALLSDLKTKNVKYRKNSMITQNRTTPYESKMHVSKRSFCPWIYVNNTDHNRWPKRFIEVECMHKAGSECGTSYSESDNTNAENGESRPLALSKSECQPVYYEAKVLYVQPCEPAVPKLLDHRYVSVKGDMISLKMACVCTSKRTPLTRDEVYVKDKVIDWKKGLPGTDRLFSKRAKNEIYPRFGLAAPSRHIYNSDYADMVTRNEDGN